MDREKLDLCLWYYRNKVMLGFPRLKTIINDAGTEGINLDLLDAYVIDRVTSGMKGNGFTDAFINFCYDDALKYEKEFDENEKKEIALAEEEKKQRIESYKKGIKK